MSCHWTTGQTSGAREINPVATAGSNASCASPIKIVHACRVDLEGEAVSRPRQCVRVRPRRDVLPGGSEIEEHLVPQRLARVDDRGDRGASSGGDDTKVFGADSSHQAL